MEMLDSCQLAYIAGFFDGEGCIFPHIPDGAIHLNISNTKPQTLYEIQKRLGGKIRHYRRTDRPEEKTVYQWGVYNQKGCLNVLKRLYPYLILKKEQAGIAIELLGGIPRRGIKGGHSPELRAKEMERRKPLLTKLKEMNKKGTGRVKTGKIYGELKEVE